MRLCGCSTQTAGSAGCSWGLPSYSPCPGRCRSPPAACALVAFVSGTDHEGPAARCHCECPPGGRPRLVGPMVPIHRGQPGRPTPPPRGPSIPWTGACVIEALARQPAGAVRPARAPPHPLATLHQVPGHKVHPQHATHPRGAASGSGGEATAAVPPARPATRGGSRVPSLTDFPSLRLPAGDCRWSLPVVCGSSASAPTHRVTKNADSRILSRG